MIEQIYYNQCKNCGWDHLDTDPHRNESNQQPEEFQQLEKNESTGSSVHGEIVGYYAHITDDFQPGASDYKPDPEQDQQEENLQPKPKNQQKNAFQQSAKSRNKGRPPKNPSKKLNDFNKYLVRKLKKMYPKCLSEDYGNKAINKDNLQKIIQQCRFQIMKLLNQRMIPFLKQKRLNSSTPGQLPFNRDKLNKNKASIYLIHSRELLQDLKKKA